MAAAPLLEAELSRCPNVESVFSELAKEPFDLILLIVPRAEDEAAWSFLEASWRNPEPPVIALCNQSEHGSILRAMDLGAQDYLIKSEITPPLLERSIRYALERRRLQSAVDESTARFQGILHQAEPMVVLDRQGVIRYANPAAEKIFGRHNTELLGTPLGIPVVPADSTDIDIVQQGGQTTRVEARVVATRWERAAAYLVSLKMPECSEPVSHESEGSSQLLTRLSHKMLTPLSVVLGSVEMLRSSKMNEDGQHYVEMAESAVRELTRLLQDVADYSRIDAGNLPLVSVRFDPHELVAGLANRCAPLARARGVALEAESSSVRGQRLGDPVRQRQVLQQLLTTALGLVNQGEVYLTCEAPQGREDTAVCYSVRASHLVLPEEQWHQFFQPFFHLDPITGTDRSESNRLGLAVSRRLVERMGGTIGLESSPTRGTTFWFTVPMAQAESDPAWDTLLPSRPRFVTH